MANPIVNLQWNCDGLKAKRLELDTLIAEYSPRVICLQETMLDPSIERSQNDPSKLPSFVKIKGYKAYFKCIPSGRNGLAIYVKNNTFHSRINLKTRLQALAIKISFEGKQFIISNHYVSISHDGTPSSAQYERIISQFDTPFIMCGDFNSHHEFWSHPHNNSRGIQLEKFISGNHLGLLNTVDKTRYDPIHHSWSLLDLSIVHPALYLDFDSKIVCDQHTSDHNPITISYNKEMFELEKMSKYNYKRADWGSFKNQCENEILEDILDSDDPIVTFTQKLIDIATDNIPMTSPFYKKCSKPWFDDECKAAKRERNKANRFKRRYPCLRTHIKAKVANAKTKRLFKKKKKESWKSYVSSINNRTPSKKVWNMIGKITGKNIPSHLIHLKDPITGELITNKLDIANKIGETFQNNSSSTSYSDEFQTIKNREEENDLNFTPTKPHEKNASYNKKFKLRDLKRAIKKSKDSSPGEDQIHYQLLKHLPNSSLNIFLNIINKFWDSQDFPASWREAFLLLSKSQQKDFFVSKRPTGDFYN